MSELNPGLLVSVHCYQGDAKQVKLLMRYYAHHQAQVVVVSPNDSPVGNIGKHWCITAGEAGYIGTKTWIRQKLQMERLLALPGNFRWFLMNDADSICLAPKLPAYLFEDDNVMWSNLINDFRRPGETSHGVTWPLDYHKGFPIWASQPPYVMSRAAMMKIAAQIPNVPEDPITPFIDWVMVAAPTLAGVKLKPFQRGASCGTGTPEGLATITKHVGEKGATFIHAIKHPVALQTVLAARAKWLATHKDE